MNNVPVVLVAPPSDHYGMPSLAVSLLKASLEKRGISCKAIYANILFHETIGLTLYEELCNGMLNNLLLECLFAPMAHDMPAQISIKGLNGNEIPEYLHDFFQTIGGVNKNITQAKYSKAEALCNKFINILANKIVYFRPKIIGFSNTFQQTNVSIALAKKIKQILPDTIFVIGGNNCEGAMGKEIADSVEIIDYVFQGEADFKFADFCQNYLENNILPEEKIINCPPSYNLDAVATPDYSDFFEQCNIPHKSVTLSFESSRGCWWGHKNQCKFCGESALTIRFRSKHPEQMIDELCQFQEKYPDVLNFFATDSIFPHTYFKDFLPKLSESNFHGKIIYETKANLTYEELTLLKKAGICRIMPGIESLSTRLLKMLNKGTNALTNIRLLRNCRELDINVAWLLLVGIPRDRASDYEEQLQLIPVIQHLAPPRITPIRIQRSSPYFREAETWGITEIKPLKAYEYAFPDSIDITNMAYYFVARYPSESRERPGILAPLKRQLDRWLEKWLKEDVPELSIHQTAGDKWMIKDTRDFAKAPKQELGDDDYNLLKQCREGIYSKDIRSEDRVKRLLNFGYLVEIDDRILSVVCESSECKEA